MDDGVAVLRDIHELDAVPWWPLAPGWWVLVTLAVLTLLVLGTHFWLRYSGMLPGWRGDARRQLRNLHKALHKETPREIASRLSILLRRIAIARSGRRGTASLSGESWLDWLEQHDSTGFRWSSRGRLLLEAPYMPPTWPVKRKEVTRLIAAASRWVKTVNPGERRSFHPWRTVRAMADRRGNV